MEQWLSDLLTVIGLTCNLVGAFLLIGIDYEYSLKVAEVIKPEFKRLDSGIDTLGNQYNDLRAGDDGFDELFDLFTRGPIAGQPLDRWTPVRIETPGYEGDKVRFVLAFGGAPAYQTVPIDFIEEASNGYVQKWFINRALPLLIFGYFLQLVSTLLPAIKDLLAWMSARLVLV